MAPNNNGQQSVINEVILSEAKPLNRLCVFGTMRKGMRNHLRLIDCGAKFIEDRTILYKRLLDVDIGVVLINSIKNVMGVKAELYEISDEGLARLDAIYLANDIWERETISSNIYVYNIKLHEVAVKSKGKVVWLNDTNDYVEYIRNHENKSNK